MEDVKRDSKYFGLYKYSGDVHGKSLPKLGRSRTGGSRLNCPWIPRDRKRPWPEEEYKCRHCIAVHRNNTSLHTLQKVETKAKAKKGTQLSISGYVWMY